MHFSANSTYPSHRHRLSRRKSSSQRFVHLAPSNDPVDACLTTSHPFPDAGPTVVQPGLRVVLFLLLPRLPLIYGWRFLSCRRDGLEVWKRTSGGDSLMFGRTRSCALLVAILTGLEATAWAGGA